METGKRGRGAFAAMIVIATAQLMFVLDDSIVNIALPSIQAELVIEPAYLPWVVNAYILAFGALLLLGGRIGDLLGRRRTLQAGIALFVVASLAGGLGQSAEVLIAARAVQGVGAALAAPNALALIATTFSDRKERDTALSLYGAMSGLGIIIGLLLGGVLTDTLGWRWVFFINVPIGSLVLLGSRTLVAAERHPGRVGLADAVLATGGMVAVVYAISRFGEAGFADPVALGLLVAGVLALAAFVMLERRSANPLVPLALLRDRNRRGALLTMLLLAIGPMGTFYVITLHLQQVQEYTPLQTGAAWLPFAAGIVVGAGAAPKLLLRTAPRYVAALGALLSAGAAAWFSALSPHTSYWLHLAPAMFVLAVGFGFGVLALTQAAVYRVEESEAGVASALLNSAQQVGVALGLSVLATVAATATTSAGGTNVTNLDLVAGFSLALLVAAALLVVAAIVALIALTPRIESARTGVSATQH